MKQILLIMIGLSLAAQADFTRDSNTQIVTDNSTGLQWADDANVVKTWTEAIGYCESLTIGTYDDWRLPNFNELYYIVDRSKSYVDRNSAFKNVVQDIYWSSSTTVSMKERAWIVHFDIYGGGDTWSSKTSATNVLCVRTGH